MIVAIFNIYLVLLFVLVHFNVVRFNLFWKSSPVIVMLLLLIGLFIPMAGARRKAPRWWCGMRFRLCRRSLAK